MRWFATVSLCFCAVLFLIGTSATAQDGPQPKLELVPPEDGGGQAEAEVRITVIPPSVCGPVMPPPCGPVDGTIQNGPTQSNGVSIADIDRTGTGVPGGMVAASPAPGYTQPQRGLFRRFRRR